MYEEPDPETEKEIIEKIAKYIVNNKLSLPTTLFLSSFKSLSWITGAYASILVEPFLPFYEKEGSNLIKTLEKIENVELLIERIEELKTEKEEKEVKEKSKKGKTSWHDKALGFIRKIVKK